VQRSISFQQSLILLCLGLAFWLMAQDWLLPRLGIEPPESIRPSDEAPAPLVGAIASPVSPGTVPVKNGQSGNPSAPGQALGQKLRLLQWSSSLGAWAPGLALLTDARSIAEAPQPQGATGKVVIDLSDRQLYVYAQRESKTAIAQYDVAIGQDGWETPPGRYLIEAMQTSPAWQHPLTQEIIPPGPGNPLGAAWISFLTTENYSLGIHGTLDESLMGQAVSHGCVRMRNADIQALYAKVALGWPLDVQP
jgi:hypothetical protein